ncbi:dihydroneopterin aldolase [Phenylobacterium sp.]|uniref:dihydroneopterin aldolase n=1 Tax=Phenylobacterium sp. TaxID=1871053 RepID=UPI0025F24369|nr:dihydroneopterin aldolase [Phenylobacterium sp.]
MDWRDEPESQTSILEDVELLVRCGLHPWERHPERPNRLKVSVRLYTTTAFDPATNAGYLDYDRIRDRLMSWPARPHVDLLESLLSELADFAFEDPRVEACRLKIFKPDIFNETAGAGVEWFRKRRA